jgi:MFS family permease
LSLARDAFADGPFFPFKMKPTTSEISIMLLSSRQRLMRLGSPFQLILLSDALMLMALMIGHIAVPWWIVQRGGAGDLAIFAATQAIASFIALPALSPLGDRYSKRNLITGGLCCMLLEAVLMAFIAQTDYYHFPLVCALGVAGVTAMAVIMPASLSLVADVLPPAQLTDGLGFQKSAQAIGRMIGPALGGMVLAAAGTAPTLWMHAGLLVVACVCASKIVAPVPVRGESARRRWIDDLRAGLAAKWHIPMERGWTFVSFLVMIFFTPGIGMLVPVKIQSLQLSGAWFGACEAGLSIGLLFGAMGGAIWLANRVGRFRASFSAILCEGLCLAIMGLTHSPVVLVFAFFLFGACVSTVQMVGQTHRMLAMPAEFRSRMTAVNMMVMQVGGIVGPAIASGGLGIMSVDGVYFAFGVALLCVGLGYTLVPGYREFLSLSHDDAKDRYAREHPHLFNCAQKG